MHPLRYKLSMEGARVPAKLFSDLASKALNDDLPSTLTVHQVAEIRSSHDRPVDANMACRKQYLKYGIRIYF